MNNENMSSDKGLTLVKTTLLPGQERLTVVASLPTTPSGDVTANIPISYILFNNKNSSSGKWHTLEKNNAFSASGSGDSGGFSANQSKP